MSSIRYNARARAIIEAVAEECERLGVVWGGLEAGSKHYRGIVIIDGVRRHLSMPSSPSDRNGAHRKCDDLRKLVRSVRCR